VNLVLVLKQTKSNAVDRSIAPAFVKEATSPVQMIKIVLIGLAAPEIHIGDLKVAPEMTRRIAVGLLVVVGTADLVGQPIHSIVGMDILGMISQKLESLGPQSWNRLRRVIEIDSEAVGFVVIAHVAEHVVVDVAKEVHLRLNAPVVLNVFQGGVLVEHARVPAAHLMI